MFRKIILGSMFMAVMALSNNFAFAENLPTLHQVYQATQAGRLQEAQGMMDKVLQAYPNSAKAHFVEAELLAKRGLMKKADAELNSAERLEPGLPFAKPQAVQALKTRIAAQSVSQSVGSGFQSATRQGFPFGILILGLGAIAAIYFVMRAMNSRNPSTFPTNYQPGIQPSGGSSAYPSGGVAPMAPAGGGLGSGIMGGLATGAALGAGMVAGEALAHHFMDGNRNAADSVTPPADPLNTASDDMGGTDFGIADNSSWDDSSSDSGSADVDGDNWN